MRYAIAKWLFRIRFPKGGFSTCDFRPHCDGYLINTHVIIRPQASVAETRKLSYQRWIQQFRWNRTLHRLLHRDDTIQMVVGFSKPPCQLLKGWIDVKEIKNADPLHLDPVGGHLNPFGENTSQSIESYHKTY
jgi:hypothetical protein